MELRVMPRENFDAFYDALESAFDRSERREREDALRTIDFPEFSVLEIHVNGVISGYVSVWALDGFAFIEHFVILEEYRNRGYGAEVLLKLKERFPNIVLEAEPPTEELRRRRLAFYRRCGFFENDFPYLQPSYRKGEEGVPLVIMSWPDRLSEFDITVAKIYRTVYGL